mmetsp:Transcript_46866/g.111599  ORF Transcript_46866/g.111599 Transcript_46866/m.111599 type:complete len:314 (+) Transcript_46866:301-1242(+)
MVRALSCSSSSNFLASRPALRAAAGSPPPGAIGIPSYRTAPSMETSQKKGAISIGRGGADCLRASCMRQKSARTRAAMVSTIGTARGTTHGSCRPFASRTVATPMKSAVGWALPMVAGGLNARRSTIGIPFEMPPWTPPEWLVVVTIRPSGMISNMSLWTEPRMRVPSKPEPIAKPFVAGIDIIACASFASSLSNTGSPIPIGQLRITTLTTPPMESSSARASLMQSVIFSAVSRHGHRTMCSSTWSRVMVSMLAADSGQTMSPTPETHDTISTPYFSLSHFSAMAPAATRPIVSRAEDRPPPLAARKPYFIW